MLNTEYGNLELMFKLQHWNENVVILTKLSSLDPLVDILVMGKYLETPPHITPKKRNFIHNSENSKDFHL